ncbi:BZ3500_MvSof-1268-A1-R1_Chr8-2g10210 [Microbotryum saponariae]|uniref:BZ3500_MvSof-1268-A1-R1_Chr8-2g10210 protein n=1 Tax=Microbotryum saponariae TaxID=289078 RepID=A0A2X0LBC7_9BASI|nr:BZ3500_MvSof-1268-A1-R1_Chr8-2g10210 [Microbotryum saponariae]SDA02008.1 BZ3501_MvSof-1269-A2-R1_Chr8-2g09960 [Microbotryum saponariae]
MEAGRFKTDSWSGVRIRRRESERDGVDVVLVVGPFGAFDSTLPVREVRVRHGEGGDASGAGHHQGHELGAQSVWRKKETILTSGPAPATLEPAAEGAGAGKPCEAVGEAVEADMLGGMIHFAQDPGRMFRLIGGTRR